MKLKPVNCVAQEYVGPGREKYIGSWKLISAIPGQKSREGNEMIKKSLIAIALVAFLATTVQAASPYIKQDWDRIYIDWPVQYKALPICTVDVVMNLGNYVQIKDCNKIKIELQQVDCEGLPDKILRGGKPSDFFPCYNACDDVEIRSNFEVKLGAKLTLMTDIIKDYNTMVYWENPGDVVGPSADYIKTYLCMWAADAEIWKEIPKRDLKIGEIEITVKPNASL
jgi:hypothetical protein